jgi:hypothetical protein
VAPAICPGCTLMLRPIFAEAVNGNRDMPSATPEELADAIVDSVDAGARVINLSSALVQPSAKGEGKLEEALNYAAHRDVITVADACRNSHKVAKGHNKKHGAPQMAVNDAASHSEEPSYDPHESDYPEHLTQEPQHDKLLSDKPSNYLTLSCPGAIGPERRFRALSRYGEVQHKTGT